MAIRTSQYTSTAWPRPRRSLGHSEEEEASNAVRLRICEVLFKWSAVCFAFVNEIIAYPVIRGHDASIAFVGDDLSVNEKGKNSAFVSQESAKEAPREIGVQCTAD